MKFLVDANFAYAKTLFAHLGELSFYSTRQPSADALKKTDVLLVRSTTTVDDELLKNAPNLKFVGSATIGTDHIDLDALKARDIQFAHAPGCNANAVKEYVLSCLSLWLKNESKSPSDITLSVIGYGNVGSKVAEAAAKLGMQVRVVDPFKVVTADTKTSQVSFQDALKSDIITFHVPLTKMGAHPTLHMLNEESLDSFAGQLIINTCRGSVIEQEALSKWLEDDENLAVLDVWENEPDINLALLEQVWLATPHIAGYSLEGKAQGSLQVYQALMEYLGQESNVSLSDILPAVQPLSDDVNDWELALLSVYNPKQDDNNFRAYNGNMAEHFDSLRKNYTLRRELKSYLSDVFKNDHAQSPWLSAIRG